MAAAQPDAAETAFPQGAGRIDVAHAITQQLTTDPVSVSFGRTLWPHGDDAPITRTVTWRNDGPAPVTVDLNIEGAGPGGRALPAGLFQLGANQLTVPAGGTAATTVTTDTRLGDADGYWTGMDRGPIRGGGRCHSAGLERWQGGQGHAHRGAPEPRRRAHRGPLDRAGDRDGHLWQLGPRQFRRGGHRAGAQGYYGLSGLVFEPGPEDEQPRIDLVTQPEVTVERDTRIVVDARRAKPVRMTIPDRTAVPQLIDLSGNFTADDGSAYGVGLWAETFTGLTSGAARQARSPPTSSSPPSAASGPRLTRPTARTCTRWPKRFPAGCQRGSSATTPDGTWPRSCTSSVVEHPGLAAERIVLPELEYNVGGSALVLPYRRARPASRVLQHQECEVGILRSTSGRWTRHSWLNPKAALFSVPTAITG